jgi:hypothetical protein
MTPERVTTGQLHRTLCTTNFNRAAICDCDGPSIRATLADLRHEVATLRREALLRDAGITTTSTEDRA